MTLISHDFVFSGYYVFAEGNDGRNRDNASVRSPPFFSGSGGSLEFWYHLFSIDVTSYQPGVLKVRTQGLTRGDDILRTLQIAPI